MKIVKTRCDCERPILVDERHMSDGVRCVKCGHRRVEFPLRLPRPRLRIPLPVVV